MNKLDSSKLLALKDQEFKLRTLLKLELEYEASTHKRIFLLSKGYKYQLERVEKEKEKIIKRSLRQRKRKSLKQQRIESSTLALNKATQKVQSWRLAELSILTQISTAVNSGAFTPMSPLLKEQAQIKAQKNRAIKALAQAKKNYEEVSK